MRRTWGGMSLIVAAALVGCSAPRDDTQANASASETKDDVSAGGAGVTRELVPAATPSASPVAQIQAPAIQTQPGPKGNNVALNRVAVTGDILTVSMTFSGGTCCVHMRIEDVSVIDDATSQRIGVLKDNAGKYMAAPLESNGTSVSPESWRTPSVVWFKFPAPPATSKTVSIALPGVAPFDAVPVTR